MVEKIFSNPKRLVLIGAVVVLVTFVCFASVFRLGWTAYQNRSTPEPTVEPINFGYCSAQLTSLCVVSFGRDVFGDTVINLYVPDETYPPFYLNIVRVSGEGRYECEANKRVKTSVLCTGDPINLGEGFEIQLFSEEHDDLLAYGSFTLNAFLVTTPVVEGADDLLEPTVTFTPLPSDNTFPQPPGQIDATPTRTPTPPRTPSYP
jgi:hypothetical protein